MADCMKIFSKVAEMYRFTVVVLVLASTITENYASFGGHAAAKSLVKSSQMMVNGRYFYDCKHMICHNVENYQEEKINRAMEQHHSLESLLKGTVFNATSDFVLATRAPFNEGNSSQLCTAEGPAKYKPKAMRNMENQWKIIVNTDRYKQVFTVEACRELSRPKAPTTRHFCSAIFGKECRQNYQALSLLIYEDREGEEDGKIQFDTFLVPTTCKCCTG